jgi:hypothetical protein
MYNHTIINSYTDDAGMVVNVATKFTGQTVSGYDGTIAALATNVLVEVAFAIADLQSLCIWSDTNLTIKTNSSTSPTQTINLLASVPIVWGTGLGSADPITADVTALYVTNAASNLANFKVRALTS